MANAVDTATSYKSHKIATIIIQSFFFVLKKKTDFVNNYYNKEQYTYY